MRALRAFWACLVLILLAFAPVIAMPPGHAALAAVVQVSWDALLCGPLRDIGRATWDLYIEPLTRKDRADAD